ncbi:hypothetical protein MVEN_00675800 [Mycena venus]|uniref:Uncharacterized protein n=1 Tax=Mycena venus TaxID=2733690 RepID=A0A8H6YRI5_9AGAR|nr:hypothetical protein MVEN_00675800 [Mycena venus]
MGSRRDAGRRERGKDLTQIFRHAAVTRGGKRQNLQVCTFSDSRQLTRGVLGCCRRLSGSASMTVINRCIIDTLSRLLTEPGFTHASIGPCVTASSQTDPRHLKL